jgi:integrase
MAHWQDRFLGIGELPPELSIFELEFFQFSPQDIAAIRKEFRPKYRIAVALQLGFMRMTGGRLNAFNVVPRKLLNLVGEQVGETAPSIASLRSMYRRGNTRRDHQAWVMQWLNIKVHTTRQERMLFAALREASKAIGSIDQLIATARQWLYDKSLLVPATSTLRDLCVRAASDTESQIYQSICRAVSSDKRLAWEKALFEKRKDGLTHLEWLQSAPKRKSQKTLRNLFKKIEYLTKLGVAEIELPEVPMERLQIYARQLQHKRPARFRRLSDSTRTLQLVSFLRVTLSDAADAVLQLAGKVTSDLVSEATEDVKQAEGARPADGGSPFVFLVGGRGRHRTEPLSYAALAKLFSRACCRAGIHEPWVSPHALRHTHASRMWDAGMRELTLQKRLGHASPESTRMYTKVSDRAVVADYRRALGLDAVDVENNLRKHPASHAN